MNFWLIKSEPYKYSWEQFEKDGATMWDGVRNYQARNNLKAMKKRDQAFFYHSNEGKCIVGIAEVIREYYPDTTTLGTHKWVAIDVRPYKKLSKLISLSVIKNHPSLQEISLIKQPRLSVVSIKPEEWYIILSLEKQNRTHTKAVDT